MEARSQLIQDYLSRLTEADWTDIYKRVRLYAYKNFGWLQKRIGGVDLEEVIIEAIEDTFFGNRQWPVLDKQGQDRKVSLVAFLCQTVRSKVSHVLDKEKHKVYLEDGTEDETSRFQAQQLTALTKENINEEVIYHQLCQKLLESLHKDVLLTKIAKLYIEMPDLKPKDIAEYLGLSVTEVRNAQKRLSRKLRNVREEWHNG